MSSGQWKSPHQEATIFLSRRVGAHPGDDPALVKRGQDVEKESPPGLDRGWRRLHVAAEAVQGYRAAAAVDQDIISR
ncbi:hypothetical protein [Desulfobulbus oligotrophicus]|uniref:Uncharacterized protein n=1 Tax=Desulfobulbus oligotrophicus TaxID=1909699 RepID=A0A7T5VEL9_9BACT|nr:hypothetical protein [Desulfobulbus oligotrophicus]QQG66376.1 hypothetical protein HP555_11100 [Desulfobulbus oligotrophicus]